MGRLIKNHWARLIILSAAAWQVGASIEGFIWPKVFWDFITKNLDGAVGPIPILQIINLVLGIVALAWEWPLKPLAGTLPHRSIELRLLVYPLSALACALMYQSGDVAVYYLIGMGIYFWAYSEGEVVCPVPWTLPKRSMLQPARILLDIDIDIDRIADSRAMNEHGIIVDHDDDVDRKRSFEGRLNRFLHHTDTKPIRQRRIITRSVSSSSSPSSPSSPSVPATSRTTPSPRKSYRLQEDQCNLTRKPKPRRKRSDNDPHNQPLSQTLYPSRLRDTIPPNLILLLVGVNPGLLTGSTGYAYAHPSNLFWKLLHSSGITPIRHPPSDTYKLPELYSIGNTNIVERPTRDASMLSKAEMDAGVPVLEAKIALNKPEAVALVGKSIWESIWRVRHGGRAIKKDEFRYGWQDESENMGRCPGWEAGARVFVATTTSGLAATMSMQQKQEVWNELGRWVQQRRMERDINKSHYF
ncbi:hypothetical protein UA08_03307 [Talaromyces atroroseus]|uniref:Uracil-DNA glycosylase-like domain-containing protein n=1 Tax=Talaromyces atroroseus TaxID=1441469 RepID=A0A225B162_TALAT|nr:hypothetical protein UA08_03307 [Talaromyces atroroseus]OKL60986.1 hypothetical protein UA08_03307 [Talaromyces atroroseus]